VVQVSVEVVDGQDPNVSHKRERDAKADALLER